jgi:uncharacterized protein YjbJ (UPF0337 family)
MRNQDEFEGRRKEMRESIHERFAKLTDDDIEQIEGKREKLIGKLRERYGDSRAEAERRLSEPEESASSHAP